jgi:hypothetical protein
MAAQPLTQSVCSPSTTNRSYLLGSRFLIGGAALALLFTTACNKSQPNQAPAAPANVSTSTTPSASPSAGVPSSPEASSYPSTEPVAADASYTPASTSPNPASVQRVWLGDSAIGMSQAMSMTIPTGWHFQGGIVRNVSCSPGDAFPQLVVSSPDGAYSLTIMTPFFTTSMPTNFNLQNCGTVAQPTTAANILTHYVAPAIRRGAQISAPESAPGWEPFLRGASPPSNGFSETRNVSRVHVAYTQNGQAIEEYIVGSESVFRHSGMNGGTSNTTVSIYKAPAGQLDAFYTRAMSTINITPTAQWQQRNMQMAQQAAQQAQQQGQQQRAAIMQQGQDAGAAGRAMLANTRNQIQATGQASMNAAAQSEAARHTAAVGTADYVGNRATSTYFFCNNSGGRTTNNNPNSPGPGWYSCDN